MSIVWYLTRYDDIRISDAGVYRILKRNGLNRLPRGTRLRKVHTIRYQQQIPGHQIQVDVKFLFFRGKDGKPIKRYQYTAIDDATRVRALKVYTRHTQANAILFMDYVTKSFPFRIREVRTDNGHEFQAKFHWHVEDQGIRHAYIKPRSPQLNGKIERSHRTDEEEFYQLLTYMHDADLEEQTCSLGAVLQSLQTAWRLQRKSTLRSTERKAINMLRSVAPDRPYHSHCANIPHGQPGEGRSWLFNSKA